MFLYFFDIDDTICNTKELIVKFLKDAPETCKTKDDKSKYLEKQIHNYGIDNMGLLHNSTTTFLREVLAKDKDHVYYITARDSSYKDGTQAWLKKHNLLIPTERILFDTDGKKGKIINSILQDFPNKHFALFFDDLLDNHEEAAKYNNIITVLPTTLNVKLDLPY